MPAATMDSVAASIPNEKARVQPQPADTGAELTPESRSDAIGWNQLLHLLFFAALRNERPLGVDRNRMPLAAE
jgi:hypothetical protein